jgi:hypothetical protein
MLQTIQGEACLGNAQNRLASAVTPSWPPQGLGHRQKRHSSRELVRPRRHLSQILPSTPEYKPQMSQPASFNPELCGGLRASRTLLSSN